MHALEERRLGRACIRREKSLHPIRLLMHYKRLDAIHYKKTSRTLNPIHATLHPINPTPQALNKHHVPNISRYMWRCLFKHIYECVSFKRH